MIVVKVGGRLLSMDGALTRVAGAFSRLSPARPLVVVPGGGVFADAVRQVDAVHRLSADAAHWMAVLAMDQYAELLADSLPRAMRVESAAAIAAAHGAGALPVLAPARWLRTVDVLPHSWEVSSDSIAAFLAGALGADGLLLIKPVGGAVAALVDGYFARARPMGVPAAVLGIDEIDRLDGALAALMERHT